MKASNVLGNGEEKNLLSWPERIFEGSPLRGIDKV